MLRIPCALLLTMLFARGALVAQSVRVLVLDAKSGKPQSSVEVHYFCSCPWPPHNFLPPDSDTTDSGGVAIVPYACHEGEEIDSS